MTVPWVLHALEDTDKGDGDDDDDDDVCYFSQFVCRTSPTNERR